MSWTCGRGLAVVELASRIDLTILNEGRTPTFRRSGCRGSIIDQYIRFRIKDRNNGCTIKGARAVPRRSAVNPRRRPAYWWCDKITEL